MESWKDQGIVLSARPHGEGGAVVSLLTESHGRHVGYVRGARSSSMRGVLESGSIVGVEWQARVAGNLGTFRLEQDRQVAALLMGESLKLGALLSACSLCDASLPERESHSGLFHGLLALMDMLEGDIWGAAYVMWEIALLRELGFGLDFSRCAGGGQVSSLAYVSPKTGRAISVEAGEPYKDRLLPLPAFLRPQAGEANSEEVLKGLEMTSYFLEHWAFAHHTRGIPEDRLRFQARFAKYVGQENGSDGVQECKTVNSEAKKDHDAR